MRGRGLGASVGTLIGAGWLIFALQHLALTPQILFGALGLVVVLWLLACSGRLLVIARRLPAPSAAARATNWRTWTLFWANFSLEIILLNVAINLLNSPALHVYWLPAISLVVGLHFLPLAAIFAAPSYWACGTAMVAVAGATVAAVHRGPSLVQSLVAAEAICNALILWGTAAWSVLTTQHA